MSSTRISGVEACICCGCCFGCCVVCWGSSKGEGPFFSSRLARFRNLNRVAESRLPNSSCRAASTSSGDMEASLSLFSRSILRRSFDSTLSSTVDGADGCCPPFFEEYEGPSLDEVVVVDVVVLVVGTCGFVSCPCRFCLKEDIRVRFLCSGNPEPVDLICGKLGALASVVTFSLISVIRKAGSMVCGGVKSGSLCSCF